MNDLLYPTCPECGRCDGISKAIVGPASPDGDHDVAEYQLACGHEIRPDDVRISSGVVRMLNLQRPDVIEIQEDYVHVE